MTDMHEDTQTRRAGFWRRVWALFFDSVIVFLPLQILVIVLYAQTNGAIQGTFGFTTSICQDVSVLPEA
ncbi:RDD family protein [Phyllobacterium sp. P30BS-XVII]|uniref:RDD family protein n=1 Tax=Phyllobacterium sp. P30BS-XVII TaxID=2587046 RepID=UPI0015FE71C5|nr:RDD family protein [Phyllobacterium sp. P30BS-XVII]MBA8902163.1 putative RDD family membrane protein YckC [Phyllobacterium sp. P30BS-XVII]